MDKAEKLFNKYLGNTEDGMVLEFKDAVVCSSNMNILKEVSISERKRSGNSLLAIFQNRPAKYILFDVEQSMFYTAGVYDGRYNCAVKVDYDGLLDGKNAKDEIASVFICTTSPERLKQIAKPVFDAIDKEYQTTPARGYDKLFDLDQDTLVSAVINGIEIPVSKRYEQGLMLSHTYDAFEYLVDAYVSAESEIEI